MFEVIGEGEYNWYDTMTVDIGFVSTLDDARALVKRYSDHQYAEACERGFISDYITDYIINVIVVGATVFDQQPVRRRVERIADSRAEWYHRGIYGLADVDNMSEDDQDLLIPPSLGEWLQHQYDVCVPGKVNAASMYVWTSVQRKIKDSATRMCKRIKHKR